MTNCSICDPQVQRRGQTSVCEERKKAETTTILHGGNLLKRMSVGRKDRRTRFASIMTPDVIPSCTSQQQQSTFFASNHSQVYCCCPKERKAMISQNKDRNATRRRTRIAALLVLLPCLYVEDESSVHAFRNTLFQNENGRINRRRRLLQNLDMDPGIFEAQSRPQLPVSSKTVLVDRHSDTVGGGWGRLLSVDSEAETTEECSTAVGPCEQCTDSERFMIPEACMDTGKRQPFHCYASSEGTCMLVWTHVGFFPYFMSRLS